MGVCDSAELLPTERTWVRDFWDDLQPHAAGSGGYVNAMSDQDADRGAGHLRSGEVSAPGSDQGGV